MPKTIELRFYAELNDFLPKEKKQRSFFRPLSGDASVKDLIESQGIPHTEVDLVLVNGEPVDFSHPVRGSVRLSVYPPLASVGTPALAFLRPPLRGEPRFVLDVPLGKLARSLRLLGFDCLYRNDWSDAELVRISSTEGRILLTRDVGVLMRAAVVHGYWLRQTEARKQLREVIRRFDLFARIAPFTRCLRCGGVLQPVDKTEVEAELPSRIARSFDRFDRCGGCAKVYWRGSHYDRMAQFVKSLGRDREPVRAAEPTRG